MNDLQIGKKIQEFIGLSISSESAGDTVGRSRLGSEYFLENIGVTILLFTAIIVVLGLLVLAVYCIAKKCNWTPDRLEKLEKVKDKIFFS